MQRNNQRLQQWKFVCFFLSLLHNNSEALVAMATAVAVGGFAGCWQTGCVSVAAICTRKGNEPGNYVILYPLLTSTVLSSLKRASNSGKSCAATVNV
jgi:hypothetical protein